MGDALSLHFREPVSAHAAITSQLWPKVKESLQAGQRLVCSVRPEKRSDAQNRMFWSALRDLAQQVVWHGQKLTDEEWKHVVSAALKRQKVVPGIDGGFVVLGQSTSRMTKSEFSDLMELVWAFGAQHDVQWSPTSLGSEQ